MVTEKQLENLKKGKATQFRSGDPVAKAAQSKGGTNSGVSRNIKAAFRAAGYDHLMAKVPDPRKRAALKKAHLPPTYLGQLILNSSQRAGVHAGMFESFCKALGITEPEQTNVIVTNNVNPYANLTEDELRKLAKD